MKIKKTKSGKRNYFYSVQSKACVTSPALQPITLAIYHGI